MEKTKVTCETCGKQYINVKEHITKMHKKDIKHHDKNIIGKITMIENKNKGWNAIVTMNKKKLTFEQTGNGWDDNDTTYIILDNPQNQDKYRNKRTGKMEDNMWTIWFNEETKQVLKVVSQTGKYSGDEFEVTIKE